MDSSADGTYLLIYLYDENGAPIGMRYRTPSMAKNVFQNYFFEKNLQGDIIGIWNQSGTKIVTYTYDAWGNVTVSGTSASTIGKWNPFRRIYKGEDREDGPSDNEKIFEKREPFRFCVVKRNKSRKEKTNL